MESESPQRYFWELVATSVSCCPRMEFWRAEVTEETVKNQCPDLFMKLKPLMRTLKSKSKLQPVTETTPTEPTPE
jgi:hypothetical protein